LGFVVAALAHISILSISRHGWVIVPSPRWEEAARRIFALVGGTGVTVALNIEFACKFAVTNRVSKNKPGNKGLIREFREQARIFSNRGWTQIIEQRTRRVLPEPRRSRAICHSRWKLN
jgi:hypothetical protein